ncbi:MAG TPA: universal stress protein [Acidimicrobiales bacterium]|nr:universal stress protein [Acidimicrobiales bacterium]
MAISKILVGTSAAGGPDQVLQAAAELASTYRAELVILQVEPAVDARNLFDPDGVPDPVSPVAPLTDEFPGLRVRARRARGSAVRTVCEAAAAERPDLVVVPSGRAGRRALLSNRASRDLVNRVACPVVLVAS